MLQVKTFKLPEQEDEANEFLTSHIPEGSISFNKDLLFIGYDDGNFSPAAKIAALRDLLKGNYAARVQQEIALHVAKYERADLNPKHNKGRYENVSAGIAELERGIDIQDVKAALVEQWIKDLQSGNGDTPADIRGNTDAAAKETGEDKEEAKAGE